MVTEIDVCADISVSEAEQWLRSNNDKGYTILTDCCNTQFVFTHFPYISVGLDFCQSGSHQVPINLH